MRILMISPQFRPLVGGYERACERLSVALAAKGHAVTVCAECREKAWPKTEEFEGVHLRRWWCVYRPRWHIMTSLLGLLAMLLQYGRSFQVWHVHQYGMHAALAVVMGKLLRRPVVLKLTNTKQYGIAQTIAQNRFPAMIAALHRRVDAVVALTPESAAEAEAFGIPNARIHVLGNGVDTETFRPRSTEERWQLKQQLGLGDALVVVFVGRLSEQKNLDGLLRAWRQAEPQMSGGWRLVLMGDGQLRLELERLCQRLGIENSVSFLGQQSKIDQWLGATDIYTLTSLHEGLSNSMLEAMATGLACVVTAVSGTRELVEEPGAGLVVPICDDSALASALVEMSLSAKMRQQMGDRARQVIVERFAVEVVAKAHEMLYESLTPATP